MQILVLLVSLFLMAGIAWFFIDNIRHSHEAPDDNRLANRRTPFIWALAAFGVVISVASLWSWPHALSAADDVVTVNATGGQWYWDIDVEEVPALRPVVFNVHTEDVNHGFGVYGPNGRLHFQVQAMPGYVNQIDYVFNELGLYQVLCMEFCGVAHHDMIAEFTVVAN